jgi:glycosyltransferase involved in cell wall biosynthesis
LSEYTAKLPYYSYETYINNKTAMKILMITKNLYPGDGDTNYAFRLDELLRANGHDVAFFTMKSSRNLPCSYTEYFAEEIDLGKTFRQKNPLAALKVLCNSLYSFESRNKIEKLIEKFKPDVAHIQHLGPTITCSILPVIKKHKIPIVYTLNIYTPLCCNYNFINETTGQVCEACRQKRFINALFKRCVKGRFTATFLYTFFQCFNHIFKYYDYIDCFICPSEFMKNKCTEYGFYPEKLMHLPYFLDTYNIKPNFTGDDYGLFFGRLVPEKGVEIILEALKKVDIPFKIVGDGRSMQNLLSLKNRLGLKNVEFTGFKSGEDLVNLISSSRFIVVPSKWYEVVGLVTMEAFSCGKPVIGSRMGGIPEVIKENETGFLFDCDDVEGLAGKMYELYSKPDLASNMGRAARADVETRYSPEVHYERLMNIYKSVGKVSP